MVVFVVLGSRSEVVGMVNNKLYSLYNCSYFDNNKKNREKIQSVTMTS